MEIRKSSRLLACACLLALTLLSGCGSSSSTAAIPTTTQIFFAHGAIFGNNSTVKTMGYNGFGQLGIGTLVSNPVATAVPNLGRMSGFSVGGDHTLAFSFTNLSSVYAWGSNYHGQIGHGPIGNPITTTGSTAYSATPVKVALHGSQPGLVTGVAAGAFHSVAVMDGKVFSWGYNGFGQLGTGQTLLADSTEPTQVTVDYQGAPLNSVQQVAVGGGHTLALSTDGVTVYAWGANNFGQLGSNPLNLNNITNQAPTPVSGLVDPVTHLPVKILQIAAAGSNSYALDENHHVWAWGYNGMGQLAKSPTDIAAVGTTPAVVATPYSFTPVMVLKADGTTPLVATKIAAGLDHVLALVSDGTVWAWGFNQLGSLGNNTIISSSVPVQVLKSVNPNQALTGVTDIEAYGNSSLARVGANPGAWWGWGDNGFGQLGFPVSNTTVGFQLLPVPVQVSP